MYDTKNEADIRARVLQKLDRSHHVFVAPVGYWLPWDPSADAVKDQVYQEEQLNELMRNYKVNEVKRDQYYQEQKETRKKEARAAPGSHSRHVATHRMACSPATHVVPLPIGR